jgi:5-methylcytosine-specific restriction enzyme A
MRTIDRTIDVETRKRIDHWRNSARFLRMRAAFMRSHVLCAFCEKRGVIRAGCVLDHIVPHRGDQTLFWSTSNWQVLCSACHSKRKQGIEVRGYDNEIGIDGRALDPLHPSAVEAGTKPRTSERKNLEATPQPEGECTKHE